MSIATRHTYGNFKLAICPPIRVTPMEDPYSVEDMSVSYKTALFEPLQMVYEADWTRQYDLATDTPLKYLLLIPEFRLPGETAYKAHVRLYRS